MSTVRRKQSDMAARTAKTCSGSQGTTRRSPTMGSDTVRELQGFRGMSDASLVRQLWLRLWPRKYVSSPYDSQ